MISLQENDPEMFEALVQEQVQKVLVEEPKEDIFLFVKDQLTTINKKLTKEDIKNISFSVLLKVATRKDVELTEEFNVDKIKIGRFS